MASSPSKKSDVVLVGLAVASIACAVLFAWNPQAIGHGYAGLRDAAGRLFSRAGPPPLVIACAAPLSGPSAYIGTSMCDGADTLLKEVNAAGGVRGHLLRLRRYDDRNDRGQAVQVAQEIGRSADVVAVVGHGSSDASNAAAPQYSLDQVPAITPTATNPRVTAAGDWYFRVIFDDDFQGAMLAYYAKLALGLSKVAVVYVDSDYGRLLDSSFSRAAGATGIEVPADEMIGDEPDDAVVNRITASVSERPGLEAVLLAMNPRQAERLVPALRGALPAGVILIGTDSLTSAVSAARGDNGRTGQDGHWSDGMYVPVPFALDTARGWALAFAKAYEARTGREPAWQTIYAYDAAKTIVEAIRAGLPAAGTSNAEGIRELRAAVRDHLAAFNAPEHSVEGLSGTIFFDAKKSVPRPFVVARAEGGGLFALPRQLQLVGDRIAAAALIADGATIVALPSAQLQLTDIVRAGITLESLRNIDEAAHTFQAEFTVWFLSSAAFDPAELVFPDATAPIVLGQPVAHRESDKGRYAAYRVRGTFRFRATRQELLDGRRSFLVRMHHPRLDLSRLVLLPDRAGMRSVSSGESWLRYGAEAVEAGSDWSLIGASVYPEVVIRSTYGDPVFTGTTMALSGLDARVDFRQAELSLRRYLEPLVSPELAAPALITFLILLALTFIPGPGGRRPAATRILRLSLGTLALAQAERLLVAGLGSRLELFQVEAMLPVLRAMWYLVVAAWIVGLLPALVWRPIERSSGAPVPEIARDAVTVVVLIVAVFAIFANIYNYSLTSVWAASGALTLVVGFALNGLILDTVSGLLLNLERPFKLLQRVTIEGGRSQYTGQVRDMNWRTTLLRTATNNLISIPNSEVSKAIITNYAAPTRPSSLSLTLVLDYAISPPLARRLLREGAASAVEQGGILKDPQPSVAVKSFENTGIKYEITFFADLNLVDEDLPITAVADGVMARLSRAGIVVAKLFEPAVIKIEELSAAVDSHGNPGADSPISPGQVQLIQGSWAKLNDMHERVAHVFYDRLFAIAPQTRQLFRNDLAAQCAKLTDMLTLLVRSLDQPDVFMTMLGSLGLRHADYRVRPEDYATVGQVLVWTLEQALGESFTPEVRQAWLTAYNVIADVMQAAGAEPHELVTT